MPAFQIGDLVGPNPGHTSYYSEENPAAVGIIIELRSGAWGWSRPEEAKILWNDVSGDLAWAPVAEVVPLEDLLPVQQAVPCGITR